MTPYSRPLWKEGMLLLQQNFQQWDAYWAETLELRLRCRSVFNWGFADLSINNPAVEQGSIKVDRALGVFENGHLFYIDAHSGLGRDIPPEPLDVGQVLNAQKLGTWVFFAIPRTVTGGVNVVRRTERSGLPAAFVEGASHISDFVDGVDSQQVPVMIPHYQLLTEHDDLSGFQTLRLAYVERRPSGFNLSEAHVPPLLAVRPESSIAKLLDGLLTDLASTLRVHKERDSRLLRESRPIMGDDLRRILRYHAIESYLPLGSMYHGLAAGAHPYDIFNWLLLMSSAIAAGRTGELRTDSVPMYDHNDPFKSMKRLVDSIRASLSDIPDQLVEMVSPTTVETGMLSYSLARLAWLEQAQFYLRIRSEAPPQRTIDRFRGAAKIATEESIPQIISLGIQGLKFELDNAPPTVVEKKPNDIFFRLDRTDAFWQKILSSRSLAVAVPATDDPNLEVTLWAVAAQR